MQRLLRDEGHALVDPGLPVHRQALIHRHCPPSIGNLFATPRVGRDGCLEWWSELPGQPQRREALSAAERTRLDERLTQRLAALGSLVEALERRGDPAAQELRALPSQPTEGACYSVGGDPVLIRWVPVKALGAPAASAISAAATIPLPGIPPRKPRRRWVVPVMLPLLLGGLALLGLGLALYHGKRFPLTWPQTQSPIGTLTAAETATPPREFIAVESTGAEPLLGTGDVQVTLRWNSSDDLDLAVTDPSGDTAFFNNVSTYSGGQLDVDSNAGCISSLQNPVENIFWDAGTAPEGAYMATVSLFRRCNGNSSPIPYELSITIDGNTETRTGTVSDLFPSQSIEFVFP
ncbi:hypothetical protein [Billgrantia aerodenitrificans]|uniref:Uncharacterized protein n=1 Tax=Billgrantia aerodenitrificans TaxID=2733483 RepID=A0ABS9AVY6_9GAMM|nr:hypothetical protein [Halomonas aerodenitrificans]MCE8025777.1 hypothetical protein [Halomonas aerodenitrificans]